MNVIAKTRPNGNTTNKCMIKNSRRELKKLLTAAKSVLLKVKWQKRDNGLKLRKKEKKREKY